MKEKDIENLTDINIRDTVDSNKININDDDDKSKLTSSDYYSEKQNIINTKEELEKVPNIIQNYLKKNNVCIVNFKDIEPVQIIKAALLQKTENARAKDFNFQFNEDQEYYFFITKELNQNYLKPISTLGNDKRKRFGKERKDSKENESNTVNPNKIENKMINLNFDYNKYVLKAIIAKKKDSGKLEIFSQEILNREICQVSHTTQDSISYYKNTKLIKPEKAKRNFDNFALLIPEKYYLIEIETKKPANETIIKEDGIVSVLYLITPKKKQTIHLFTMVKYAIYFIHETLCNYIGKYIHDDI